MSEPILTHDAGVSAFEDAGGVVSTSDDDGVSFNWDEQHVVTVDAPADMVGAFDTDQFYKIDGATIARPIKQPYLVGDDVEWYKKPAAELERSAWSFDNAPFTLGHPDTGMVKNVDDIHGFWRNPRYDADEDRLKEDLYVPVTDDEALEWIEEHSDVSVGFYNRVAADYSGDTGDLTDDDVDGFQVDMFGNHIAGVEQGRCSGEDGCGLDSETHGQVYADTDVHIMTDSEHDREYAIAPPTADYMDDDTYYAVAPDENSDDEPKYPIESCSDVHDAWQLRGQGDMDIEQSTLENRIQERAREMGCDVPEESEDADCAPCTEESNMGDDSDPNESTDTFDVPDLSVDAVAAKNDDVQAVVDERDELRESIDEMESEIRDAFDSAEHFSVDLDEDECPCEAVEDLVADLDEKAEKVEDLTDELEEYREEEKEERLDTLEDLGADREEWADDSLDDIKEEVERRKEVLDAAPDVSVKDIESSTDADEGGSDEEDRTITGTRTFGRGKGA